MRLFVAAYPSAEALAELSALVDTLAVARPAQWGGSMRLVPPERRHLTLVFLGDVADERADDAAAGTGEAVDAWRAAGGTPPSLRLAGGGSFGRGRFTVLWCGVDGDVPGLADLAARVRREVRRAGLPADPKPFRAHLTLARPGDRIGRDALDADLAALAEHRGPRWEPDGIHLVRSHLGPQPRYETVRFTPLAPH